MRRLIIATAACVALLTVASAPAAAQSTTKKIEDACGHLPAIVYNSIAWSTDPAKLDLQIEELCSGKEDEGDEPQTAATEETEDDGAEAPTVQVSHGRPHPPSSAPRFRNGPPPRHVGTPHRDPRYRRQVPRRHARPRPCRPGFVRVGPKCVPIHHARRRPHHSRMPPPEAHRSAVHRHGSSYSTGSRSSKSTFIARKEIDQKCGKPPTHSPQGHLYDYCRPVEEGTCKFACGFRSQVRLK